MTDEILEKLKTNGLRITYRDKYMQYDDNDNWVVLKGTKPDYILLCHPDLHLALDILLHG